MRLNRKQSIIFSVFYFVFTLILRFVLEPYLLGYYWISIGIGLYFILLFWLLYHKKFLNFHAEADANEGKTAKSRNR